MARHITIDQIVTESLQGLARLNALVDGLSDAQMLWRPSPSSWSIAECLDHLNRTLALYTGQLRIAFERERQNAPLAPSSFRVGFIASKMASFLDPPYRLRTKAVAKILPDPKLVPANVVQEYIQQREALLEFAKEAARVDMSSIRISSPILRLLKFSITESLVVILAHDRRHLWQSENVRSHPNFPKS
jgi:hypothetical protein